MAEMKIKEVLLSELFESKRGNSKYTKRYCNQNPGKYEVFTGTTIDSFAFIDTYDYEQDYLSYTTDGENAGTLKILKGKYSVGAHRALLIPLKENINIEYFKIILQPILFSNVKRGNVPSISWRSIKDTVLSIPIKENGQFDIEYQSELVEKHNAIEIKKTEIKDKLDYINSVEIDFINSSDYQFTKLKVKEIFDLKAKTNSSKFTKRFIKDNAGNIPVYGASKDNLPSYGYIKDNAVITTNKHGKKQYSKVLYFEDCLSYNIDGLAGYIFYRKGRFSLSEKVRPLIIQDKFKDKLDPQFLKYFLQPLFRENIKGRQGKNGKNEYTKLNQKMIEDIEIKIPVNSTGEIDIDIQHEVVKKYKIIEDIKKQLYIKVNEILATSVNFD
ncbi:restriction endonuclease subunit S [Staphylococcus chromogenes]|uniref:restriction endonuclease subunit S n=2 Tax=Staphylococcus TaxID=1279 RepID=UPI002886583C|nr:restriction endonuclease subunit S [Staphylococcus chromogenes]MDT0740477.1 restriction endonuclease subunit S [Staphylococcus chromogenes]HDS3721426.1 restriction endonuclease subunit S [Staphylococcus aureus]